jgi:hypothetical protein
MHGTQSEISRLITGLGSHRNHHAYLRSSNDRPHLQLRQGNSSVGFRVGFGFDIIS